MKLILGMTVGVMLAAGAVAEAAVWCRDADGDGFGDPNSLLVAFYAPPLYVANGWDCDDQNPMVHPASSEVCGNAVDEDCDNLLDNGCTVWVLDVDGDGWGDNSTAVTAPTAPPGYMGRGKDCNDLDPLTHPQAGEICGDQVDNDCDNVIDTGCNIWYRDLDQDGYGDPSQFQSAIAQPVGYVQLGTDCHDGDPQINPGATEICDNGLDDDCDGFVDECAVASDRPSWGAIKSQYR